MDKAVKVVTSLFWRGHAISLLDSPFGLGRKLEGFRDAKIILGVKSNFLGFPRLAARKNVEVLHCV